MSDKIQTLTEIIQKIAEKTKEFNIPFDNNKKQNYFEFLDSAVNGDTPISSLTVDANLTKDIPGIIVYILTNKRIIKVDIDAKEIQASNYPISQIINVRRKLIENESEVIIEFENESFGLKYPKEKTEITKFFELVENTNK